MPSKVGLKIEILELKKTVRNLEDALNVSKGAERQLRLFQQDLSEKYTALMTQFQRLDKEYGKLGEMWNAFQGATYRPTEKDMIQKKAQAEVIQYIAGRIAQIFMPPGLK